MGGGGTVGGLLIVPCFCWGASGRVAFGLLSMSKSISIDVSGLEDGGPTFCTREMCSHGAWSSSVYLTIRRRSNPLRPVGVTPAATICNGWIPVF